MSLPESNEYITVIAAVGDTFDMLALDYYDEELLSSVIIQCNPEYADVIVFDEPTEIRIPIISDQDKTALPPWRQ